MRTGDESWLACPACGVALHYDANHLAKCGHGARLLAEGFFSCTATDVSRVKEMLDWPTELVEKLPALAADGEIDASLAKEFTGRGLLSADGALTQFGQNVRYHLLEHRWQGVRKPLDGLWSVDEMGEGARVLDVGCGAAQSLRLLGTPACVALVGVDQDLTALALGYKLAEREGIDLILGGASAYELPFRDESFDLVLTRVALNYMHQRRALSEMVRVLRRGGVLFCRVESALHDLAGFLHPGSIAGLACRFRDFAYGTLLAVSGWQPTPGSRLTGGRAFATRFRISTTLDSLRCDVVASVATGPIALGCRGQLALLARRRSA
jgi:SAM-dependent methyltransferase